MSDDQISKPEIDLSDEAIEIIEKLREANNWAADMIIVNHLDAMKVVMCHAPDMVKNQLLFTMIDTCKLLIHLKA